MKNPFKYGCVVEGEYFCPRPQLHKQLAAYIESGQNVVIQGARRMGKTSLIKETVGSMRGYRLLFVDLYCIRSLSDFCRRVMTSISADVVPEKGHVPCWTASSGSFVRYEYRIADNRN